MELAKFVVTLLPKQQRSMIRVLPVQLSSIRSLLKRAAAEGHRTKRDGKQPGTRH